MNLYEGAISGPADGPVLSLGSKRLALPGDLGQRRPGLVASEARKLVVGIRPEHLTVAEGRADREATLTAHVELVEALGNESLVHFSTDARTVRNRGGAWTADPTTTDASGEIAGASAAEGVARVDPFVRVSTGDRIELVVDVRRLHFFDSETGDAIEETGRSNVAAAGSPVPT
jgi:multiple sugar transport system ATP-binding protein